MADSLQVVESKLLYIRESKDSNEVVQEKISKEMEMKLRRGGLTTLQSGY
jgi:hypothetical protein